MNRKGFAPLVVVGIVATLIVIGALGYFAWKNSALQQPSQSIVQNSQPQAISTPRVPPNTAPTSTLSPQANPMATSSVADGSIINDQFGLFTITQYDILNNISPTTKYFDDGLITSGKYTGYHHIIGSVDVGDPGGFSDFIFATKDYKSFVLDNSATQWFNQPDNGFNTKKVVALDTIPLNHPASINLGSFVLVRSYIDWSPSKGVELTSKAQGLRFFTLALPPGGEYRTSTDAVWNSYVTNRNKYLSANSSVAVEDQNGLVYDYSLVSVEAYNRSQNSSSSYLYNAPFYLHDELTASAPIYQSYSMILPGGCSNAGGASYILQNISSGDLTQIATTANGVALYALKDSNHALNQAEYYAKVTSEVASDYASTTDFQMINKIPPPSYQDYIAKNPILVFQDPWGRWVGIGEFQYILEDGCGKPVIYLYPQKPTEVTIKFSTPMLLATDIPTYANQWRVMANPDGALIDLQPQLTNCSSIDFAKFGSEYAEGACEHNNYPYLYWAGQANNDYPTPDGGWIVSQDNLSHFLDDKLIQIGLTKKEKTDMLDYWVPEFLAKNSPYYRISFFQTGQMDRFIPMEISPKPDTAIRIFLDWSPLSAMPTVQPQPEILQHINRQGFTVVEWGGLKH